MSDCIGCLLPLLAWEQVPYVERLEFALSMIRSEASLESPRLSVWPPPKTRVKRRADLVSFQVLMVTSSKMANPFLDEK